MPSISDIRARQLLSTAEEVKATAAANLVPANATADATYAAIVAAVKAAGYTDFSIDGSHVTVPARLRSWSAAIGVSTPSRVSIGLESLVTAFNTANVTATKRRNEHDGLIYVIAEVNTILSQSVDFEAPTTASDLNALFQMLASIQTSMAS